MHHPWTLPQFTKADDDDDDDCHAVGDDDDGGDESRRSQLQPGRFIVDGTECVIVVCVVSHHYIFKIELHHTLLTLIGNLLL